MLVILMYEEIIIFIFLIVWIVLSLQSMISCHFLFKCFNFDMIKLLFSEYLHFYVALIHDQIVTKQVFELFSFFEQW